MTFLEIPTESFREGSIPVLETQRLVLRAPQLEDVKHVAALANDKRIAENTRRIPHPYSHADAEDFISAVNVPAGEVAFVIALRNGTIVGACGLAMQDDAAPDVGYWLGVNYWGQGFDHEALSAGARVTNPASRRILEKCGFQWTGVGLCRIRSLRSSAPIDRFRLDRGLWSSLKSWGAMKRVA
jgi:RimJ/RimL family protein N-acetyltransferase